jgi:hypothetical protein
MKYLTCALIAASLAVATAAHGQVAEVIDAPTLEAGSDEAIVYFTRLRRQGGAINFWAFVDDIPIGVTRARDCVAGVVPAGERVVWSTSGNVSALRVLLEPGQTYYFDQRVGLGGIRARVRLEVADAEDAIEDIEDCDFKGLTAEGRERAQEIIADDYQEAQDTAE